ncbi:hypothetical protein BDR06DRAFT_971948 [Suillus hirtellus]|nr:hypothetical protein BDR06DRAFT_971948 [Suillus hirtellus]
MHPPSILQNLATSSFQGGTQLLHSILGKYKLQNSVSNLTARMESLEEANQQLYQHMIAENEKLTKELKSTVTLVKTLQTEITQIIMENQAPMGKKTVRYNISNKHHTLKGLLHPLFYDLCNVNSNLTKLKHIKLICDVKPLETSKLFKTDKDRRKIWFPKWQANDLCDKNRKGEIPDSTYETGIISKCAKAYFQNIHKQYKELNNAELGLKALTWKTNSKHCSCQQAAAKVYENETEIQGVMVILDTDFALDILSYVSNQELSEDMLERRKEWRSPDFVAFGRWLTLKNKRDPDDTDPPFASKKTIPFKLMIAKSWMER